MSIQLSSIPTLRNPDLSFQGRPVPLTSLSVLGQNDLGIMEHQQLEDIIGVDTVAWDEPFDQESENDDYYEYGYGAELQQDADNELLDHFGDDEPFAWQKVLSQ